MRPISTKPHVLGGKHPAHAADAGIFCPPAGQYIAHKRLDVGGHRITRPVSVKLIWGRCNGDYVPSASVNTIEDAPYDGGLFGGGADARLSVDQLRQDLNRLGVRVCFLTGYLTGYDWSGGFGEQKRYGVCNF